MKIKYGIISTATIVERFIGAVHTTGDEVEAIASRSLNKASNYAIKYHIPKAYGNYEELYQDPAINVVYIATINKEHVKEIKSALAYGKHVLCEKPIALSQEDAKEVYELAKSKNLFLMEMQKSVFLPITQVVKQYIDKNILGRLYQVSMSATFDNPDVTWMHDASQGGVVYGSASYTLEYLSYLLNPSSTKVQVIGMKEATGTIDAVSINIKMDNVLINSIISMKGNTNNYATFYFEKGFITVPEYWKARTCSIHTATGIEEKEYLEKYEMRYELEHVRDCLKANKIESSIMTSKRSINCCEIVDEIIQSI